MNQMWVTSPPLTAPEVLLKGLLNAPALSSVNETFQDFYVPSEQTLEEGLDGIYVKYADIVSTLHDESTAAASLQDTDRTAPSVPSSATFTPPRKNHKFFGALSHFAQTVYQNQHVLQPNQRAQNRTWSDSLGPRPDYMLLMANKEKLLSLWHSLTNEQKKVLVRCPEERKTLNENARMLPYAAAMIPKGYRRSDHRRLSHELALSSSFPAPSQVATTYRPDIQKLWGSKYETIKKLWLEHHATRARPIHVQSHHPVPV